MKPYPQVLQYRGYMWEEGAEADLIPPTHQVVPLDALVIESDENGEGFDLDDDALYLAAEALSGEPIADYAPEVRAQVIGVARSVVFQYCLAVEAQKGKP